MNQDSYVTCPHLLKLKHCHLFGVNDGHGPNGHHVSALLKQSLPSMIETELQVTLNGVEKEGYPPFTSVKALLTKAFEETN